MSAVATSSVELVVTSPPYPMIEMWDDVFAEQDPAIRKSLTAGVGAAAFEGMHVLLDTVWSEVHRVLVDGGIVCINVGDATRTIGESFALYPNHSRITTRLLELGFATLPAILWRKPTNAPNKFMGSGMMPPGAYVTLEHEYILVARKGKKREFPTANDKAQRRASTYFWEERNQWFSDVWSDLQGAHQNLVSKQGRERSGAFPLELPYRLINMFSVRDDTVLDPFVGTGTTMFAAMAAGRHSFGFERSSEFASLIEEGKSRVVELARSRIQNRLDAHCEFVKKRHETRGQFGYRNVHYGFPVVTKQETELFLDEPLSIERHGDLVYGVAHTSRPKVDQLRDWAWFFEDPSLSMPAGS
jgi:DNA modification methylase